jgi:prolycopene isomerase
MPASFPGDQDQVYDVVVVGSGLGGLSAAGFLGKAGRKVLLVEARDKFGGVAAQFERGPYKFDPAIHIMAVGENYLMWKALRYLEVFDQLEFVPTGGYYDARFPEFSMRLPGTREGYIETLAREFPGHEEALERFTDLCQQIHREVHSLPPHLTLSELDEAVKQFPTMFKYRMSTLGDVLDEFFGDDERLKETIGSWWAWWGLPPSKLSFFTVTTPHISFLNEGAYVTAGGTQSLVNALVSAVERTGGELRASTPVKRIVLTDGRVSGVELEDGTVVHAPIVVSAIDARRTFDELVGVEALPKGFARKVARLKPSLSAVAIYAATSLDVRALDAAHTTFLSRHLSSDRVHEEILDGRPGGIWLSIPTIPDPSLAPEGEHLLIWTCMAHSDAVPDEASRDAYVQEVLAMTESMMLPGLRENITFLESATPRTIARFGGSRDGAVYGWENSPFQAGTRRLHHRTPVEGLFLCGHWTQPGSGTFRAIFSGVETTMNLLGAGFADQFLRGLVLEEAR